MTDASAHIDYAPEARRDGDTRTMLLIIYGLYFAGFLTSGVTTIAGLILAYVGRGGAPAWAQSHYEFQIRTFWLLLVASVAFVVLVAASSIATLGLALIAWIFLAAPAVIALMIWYAVRVANGFNHALNSRAYPEPDALLI